MLTKFNLFCEEIIKELDKTKFIPVKFINGSDAIGIDYNGNNQPWLMRRFTIK